MQEAMHAARVVAAHDALLALVSAFNVGKELDAVGLRADCVLVSLDLGKVGDPQAFSVNFFKNEQPIGGEGY